MAIIGSGPAGFYAAAALLKAGRKTGRLVRIDMLERLPAPFGLVRYGVAPDHAKIKQAIDKYVETARDPAFNYMGNVELGSSVSVGELTESHHVVIVCTGAATDRRLGIPGEDLAGSHTATEFVGWYNGHPDFSHCEFDLCQQAAVVIGQGNVAVDLCRILASTTDELKHTDIAEHALEALAQSRIRDIFMIGRRGPAQAKFNAVELRELGDLADADMVVRGNDLVLNTASEAELRERDGRGNLKNQSILREYACRAARGRRRRLHFHFLQSPVRLLGSQRVSGAILQQNELEGEPFQQSSKPTGRQVEIDAGLVFRSVGYLGVPIAGMPFDARLGVLPNEMGRIIDDHGRVMPWLYAAGWVKRGPTGLIGNNRADAIETVNALLSDVDTSDLPVKLGARGIYPLLSERNVRVVSFADWQRIDAEEISRGKARGKPREKFISVREMLALLD